MLYHSYQLLEITAKDQFHLPKLPTLPKLEVPTLPTLTTLPTLPTLLPAPCSLLPVPYLIQ
ncbi:MULTISPECIES: hypothetical protein [unclassified Moorena]|uniref:hypothetical protein n=1 Tax=unclassified Moorena TaxID=2683338 RepID=UPI0013FBE1BD|nr:MULTISPECIES: hypothetical protein [unclassified Moorena]NEO13023.1 hypothetical protein [Moorena sp. SIO3E8]NEP28543.1 hypothetical protein [Moorena sp. SIO3I6]NEQ00238.1 hypothetical protein [Moorena sp. SIO3F7]